MREKGKVSVLLAALLLLSGCSSKMSNGIVTIQWWAEPNPVRQKQLKLFNEAHYPFKVELQTISRGIDQKFLTAMAGGAAPDVLFMMDWGVVDFVERNALEPLDDYLNADTEFVKENYFQKVLDCYQFNGRQYALPGSFTTVVLYYNKRLFAEAEVKVPDGGWTWEELLNAARKLTIRDATGRVSQFGIVFDGAWQTFMFIYQNGGKFYNDDGTRCIVNSPENVEVLEFLRALRDKYHVTPSYSEVRSMGAEREIVKFFSVGRAAMMTSGRWRTIELRKVRDIDFGIVPVFQRKKKATLLVSMGWAIPKSAKHKREAWEFVRFLSGPAAQKAVAQSGDGVPVYKLLAESKEFLENPDYPEEKNNYIYWQGLEYAYRWPVSPYIPSAIAYDIFLNENLEKFYLGELTAGEALQNTEERINKIIAENRME